jgi:hypothetical protein
MIFELLLLFGLFVAYHEWREWRESQRNFSGWKTTKRKRRRYFAKKDAPETDIEDTLKIGAGIDYMPNGREQVPDYPRLRVVSGGKE